MIVYSGGGQNDEQKNSLGGFPSPVEINDDKNNLFDNVTPKQTSEGHTDYRCFYVFNDGVDAQYTVTVFIEYLNEVGATVNLGVLLQNEVQRLTFAGTPTGGTFKLSIQGTLTDPITWNSDGDVLAAAIQSAIEDKITTCTVVNSGTNIFTITFTGVYQNKALSAMSANTSLLTPLGTISATVTRIQYGSPINTIAPDTGDARIVPTGVPFFQPLSPGVEIGTISPSEGFPVWVKRTVEEGFDAVENDGFKLHLKTVGTLV